MPWINKKALKRLEPISKYSKYIPWPSGKTVTAGKGQSAFAVNLIVKTALDNQKEALKLAKHLKGANLEQTLSNIHHFVYNNFQYKSEGLEHDLQTLSRAFHEYREEGINCEDSTLIILQLLSALGITGIVRRIHQASAPEVASHVYVIVPKNQKSKEVLDRNSYWTLDGTLPQFNTEAPFVKKIDVMAEPTVKYRVLNGADLCSKAENPKVLGQHPKDKNLVVILITPKKEILVEKTPKNIEILKGMNCACMDKINKPLNEANGGDSGFDINALFEQFTTSNPPPSDQLASKIGQYATSVGGEGFGQAAEWYNKLQYSILDNLFGHSNKEQERLNTIIENWKRDNVLILYPRKSQGGPWRDNLGAGKMDAMTRDELRYFIEYRLPTYEKYIADDSVFGDGTKQRVIERHREAIKALIEIAKSVYIGKFGCYEHSGLYTKELGQVHNGKLDPNKKYGAYDIRSYIENCAKPTSGSGKFTSNDLKKKFSSGGTFQPSNPGLAPKKAGFGNLIGTVALIGIGTPFLISHLKNKKKKGLNEAPQEVTI